MITLTALYDLLADENHETTAGVRAALIMLAMKASDTAADLVEHLAGQDPDEVNAQAVEALIHPSRLTVELIDGTEADTINGGCMIRTASYELLCSGRDTGITWQQTSEIEEFPHGATFTRWLDSDTQPAWIASIVPDSQRPIVSIEELREFFQDNQPEEVEEEADDLDSDEADDADIIEEEPAHA